MYSYKYNKGLSFVNSGMTVKTVAKSTLKFLRSWKKSQGMEALTQF